MNNVLIARANLATAIICIGVVFASPAPVLAKDKAFLQTPVSDKKSIRFYTANKALQSDRVRFTGGETNREGCHNFLKKTRVYSALQIGFGVCHLYEKKNCLAETIIPVQSEKQQYSSFFLKEGVAWYTQGEHEQGVRAASWSCGNALEEGEMRNEVDLSEREIRRLNVEKRTAKEELRKAQEKFSSLEKATDKAKGYAKRARAEAVHLGYIEAEDDNEDEEQGSADDS